MFSDLIFGTQRGTLNNNCYAWALDAYRENGGIKLQPGDLSLQSSNKNSVSCAFLKDRALDDSRSRGIRLVKPEARCPNGFYKIMAFIDKGNDYHWYKQHKDVLYRVSDGETLKTIAKELGVPMRNVVSPTPAPRKNDIVFVKNAGVFSHKQGFATRPILRDASGKIISDPRSCNRNYGMYNYKTFCGAMCIRNVRPKEARAKEVTKQETSVLQKLLRKRMQMPDMTKKKSKKSS